MGTVEFLFLLRIHSASQHTWLHNDILLIVYHRVELLGRQSEQVADLVRQ